MRTICRSAGVRAADAEPSTVFAVQQGMRGALRIDSAFQLWT
jgi:hypothetical protein